MTRGRKRRHYYTSEQKVSILKRHLVEREEVTSIWEELHLHPTVFYEWQRKFFENGVKAFESEEKQESKNEIQKIRWKDFPRSSVGTYHHNFLAFIDLAHLLKALNLSVDVRFLSECEQPNSLYHPPKGASQFLKAFKEFRTATPQNVRFIFSPCAFSSPKVLSEFTNFGRAPFDYIGATVYTDTVMGIERRYAAYYDIMSALYPRGIFRIDELGAPYADARAIRQFIESSPKKYPQLKHICLFDGRLNNGSYSQRILGRYGIDFSKQLLR